MHASELIHTCLEYYIHSTMQFKSLSTIFKCIHFLVSMVSFALNCSLIICNFRRISMVYVYSVVVGCLRFGFKYCHLWEGWWICLSRSLIISKWDLMKRERKTQLIAVTKLHTLADKNKWRNKGRASGKFESSIFVSLERCRILWTIFHTCFSLQKQRRRR